jgi:hypothetical protein
LRKFGFLHRPIFSRPDRDSNSQRLARPNFHPNIDCGLGAMKMDVRKLR